MPENKCRIKGCKAPVDPGYDLCFRHRVEWDAAVAEKFGKQEEQLEQDFRETFGSEAGERVLAYLASAFFLGDSTITIYDKGIDPLQLAAQEGSRLVVLRILALAGRLNLQEMEEVWREKVETPA